MPSVMTMAKLKIVPEPKAISTTPAISVVTFESAIVAKAFSKPALMAACGLVAVFPLLYWISAQPAFRVTEGGATE